MKRPLRTHSSVQFRVYVCLSVHTRELVHARGFQVLQLSTVATESNHYGNEKQNRAYGTHGIYTAHSRETQRIGPCRVWLLSAHVLRSHERKVAERSQVDRLCSDRLQY